MIKKIFFLVAVLATFFIAQPLSAQFNFDNLDKSDPIRVYDKKNIIIQNLSITSLTGNALTLEACENVIVRNCYFGVSKGAGISIQRGVNITIENCFFSNNRFGVQAQDSRTIKVLNSQFLNVHGDESATVRGGNFIQYNQVNGEGNLIIGNKMEAFDGETDVEDLISIFASFGTANSPITIKNNILKGGGPSMGGGSIQTGDGNGAHIIVDSNLIYHPAGFGIAASGGNNIRITNNKIVLRPVPPSWHTGIYTANYSPQRGDCYNITVANNLVNYNATNGFSSPFIDNRQYPCSALSILNNNWLAPSSIFTLPSPLLSLKPEDYDRIRKESSIFNTLP